MASDVNFVVLNLSEQGAGTHLLWQAPSKASGGGFTILGAGITALTAGTTTVQLLTYSSAGTPVVSGTITATAMGGTLAPGVPMTATISDGWVDYSEWVAAVIVGAPVDGDWLSIRYTMGR